MKEKKGSDTSSDDDEDLILNDSNFLKAPFVSIEVLMILEVEDGDEGSVILNLL